MATLAEFPVVTTDPEPTKRGRSRKALKQNNPQPNESNTVNLLAPADPTPPENSTGKENNENLSQPRGRQKKTSKEASRDKQTKPEEAVSSFEKELQEMQKKIESLKLENEKTAEMLRVKEDALKAKEEELELKDNEQEQLKMELKKLQKLKEFKPNMTFPIGFPVKDQEQGKKKVDPLKKKPSPPYVLWCKDQWNEVKKDNQDADFKAMSNLMGAKWKLITAEEKRPYEERYQLEKEKYMKIVGNERRQQEAMRLLEDEQKQKTAMELLEQYLQFKQDAETENIRKTKKDKDPLKPKNPLTAYFMFANERRAALLVENKNVLEVAKKTGEEWKNMSEKQKAPYEQMAAKNKEQYLQEMELYKQKKEEETANLKKEEDELMKLQKQEALQLLKKKEKTENLIKKTKQDRQKHKEKGEKNVDPNKPKKPASSFLLFSKEARKNLLEERNGISNSTLNALISVKWKDMSEEEKRIWNDKAAEAMEVYKKEVEAYKKRKMAAEDPQNQ